MMTSKSHASVYTGVTSNIAARVWQHKTKQVDGFTKKYNCTKLVYIEVYDDVRYALEREKNIKAWKRAWKDEVITKQNPEWRDLYDEIMA